MKGTVYGMNGENDDFILITVRFPRAGGPGDLASLHLNDSVSLTPESAEG